MKWLIAEKRAEELEKKLRNTTKREKRSQSSLTELLQEVREHNMLSDELQEKLDAFKGTGTSWTSRQTMFILRKYMARRPLLRLIIYAVTSTTHIIIFYFRSIPGTVNKKNQEEKIASLKCEIFLFKVLLNYFSFQYENMV